MNRHYEQVYYWVARIPRGKVATYGQIARWSGIPRSARAVVWAMRAASSALRLPCHRVVNRAGVLAPDYVFGSKEQQRALLEREGVQFLPDGRIDLAHSLWDGPSPEFFDEL